MQSLGKLLVYSANRIPRFECHQAGNCMFSTSHALLAKVKFERTRENVNIVTLGGHQHGKTWLASELSRVLAAQEDGVTHKTAEMIDHSSSERENRNGQIFFTKSSCFPTSNALERLKSHKIVKKPKFTFYFPT